jgi:ubiquinone/menaquinone biosynthesis C-methylase UbiE
VPPYRDVAEFNDRAVSYDHGWRGRLHHEIADRTGNLALATVVASPRRVLDLGCGTGYLVRALAGHYPDAEQLVGIDAAPEMVRTASATTHDDRLTFAVGVAEQIGHPDETFDLIVSTTSFDHWSDQQAGLIECARVLRPGGQLVARRPVLLVADADNAHQPPRQSPHQAARHPSAAGCRVLLPAMAPVVCSDHQRGDRDEAGLRSARTFIALERAEAAV